MEFNNKLNPQEVIPHIMLQSSYNKIIDTWDYKQKKNMIIIFYHGNRCEICKKKLEEYNNIYPRMKDFRYLAEFLAISYDNIDQIKQQAKTSSIDFPMLSDPEKKITKKFTYNDNSKNAPFPSIFITDKYGALWYQKIAKKANQLPSAEEILDWSFSINCEC